MIKKEVQIGDCRLLLGDCLSIMPLLDKVDAVVTDPPYGLNIAKTGRVGGGKMAAVTQYKASEWDSSPCSDEALDLMLNKSTAQIIFGGNYFNLSPTQCWLVWDKQNTGNFADCELAWTNMNKPVRKIEWLWNGMIRKGNDTRQHPTQKPVGVMEWCINQLPEHTETILDPFMGSGTTGVACAKLGRKFIGIELDPDYFEIACERIRKAYEQPDLFIEPPKQLKQQSFLEDGQ